MIINRLSSSLKEEVWELLKGKRAMTLDEMKRRLKELHRARREYVSDSSKEQLFVETESQLRNDLPYGFTLIWSKSRLAYGLFLRVDEEV